ncbi:MAG: ATP-grasp domain-containing protein [Planctomycetia bacterium]|nr:ATP-grasp domain-containing protein [Planctomycetia bacterium]
MYTGALENYPSLVDGLAKIRPLLGNGADVLRRVRQPAQVANALRAAGLFCPAFAFDSDLRVDTPSLSGASVATTGSPGVPSSTGGPATRDTGHVGPIRPLVRDGSWLRKSLRSAGGAQVTAWDRHAKPGPPGGDFYFQQRIDGLACSAVYVAAGGDAVLLGITRQLIGVAWTGANGFRYCGSIGPLALAAGVETSFAKIGGVLARAFHLVGLFGVDAIVNEQGVWPVEVNPRYTASTELLEWAAGLHAIDVHLTACEEGRVPSVAIQPQQRLFGKAILFASEQFVVSAELCSFLLKRHDQRPPAMADIPVVGTTIEAGWPIVTVFAAAADEHDVLRQLHQHAVEVRSLISP